MVLTRDALLEDVWGTDFPGETRTVDVHIAEVRRKLGPDGPPIETIRGVGYRLVPPAREPVPGIALAVARRSRSGRPCARDAAQPDGRIVGAFALLAIVLWLAIGATMFVVLRALHADATSSSLADTAQTLRSGFAAPWRIARSAR